VSDSSLKVRVYGTDAAWIVVADGEVDLGTVALLEHGVADGMRRAAKDGGVAAVVDLTGVTFMDSMGLRVLIVASLRSTALRFVVATPELTRLLQISGLDEVLTIHPSLDAALAA
jgi:anti-anti-sigma factor